MQEKASCRYDRLKFTTIDAVERKRETAVDVVSVEKVEEDEEPQAGVEEGARRRFSFWQHTALQERLQVEERVRRQAEENQQEANGEERGNRDLFRLVEERQRRRQAKENQQEKNRGEGGCQNLRGLRYQMRQLLGEHQRRQRDVSSTSSSEI